MFYKDGIPISEITCSDLNIYSGDLRISITSDCNMNCIYCHAEGKKTDSCISLDKFVYIVTNAMNFGVKSLRITGGEPTTHPELISMCEKIKQLFPELHLGLNTNGMESDKLLFLAHKKLVDRIVFGVDYFDSVVSKNSQVGKSSKEVLSTVLQVVEAGCRTEIDVVYNGDYNNIFHLCAWCIRNNIRLKILEEINDEKSEFPNLDFTNMISKIISDFQLKAGNNIAFNDVYGCDAHGVVCVSFFHSLCRTRECAKCARMHMRITSEGKTKPCLKNSETEFDLLQGDFQMNLLKGICSLGVPPELSKSSWIKFDRVKGV